MKILIIGGSRFVGPPLVELLIGKGHQVYVFNRGIIRNEYGNSVAFIRGDRNEGFGIQEHFDVVIDMCAYTGAQTQRALDELSYNFFINFGTAASYKKSELFPLTEESPLGAWPVWGDYNVGKVECEQVLGRSGKTFATIRPVYILGAHNYVDREHFIYTKLRVGEPVMIPGNGQAICQFVFAKDVAAVLAFLAEQQIPGAFNCAGDEGVTLTGLVEYMAGLVGQSPILKYNPSTDGEKLDEDEFPFANENFYCSNEKLKKLGVSFTPLRQGLRSDYDSYYKSA